MNRIFRFIFVACCLLSLASWCFADELSPVFYKNDFSATPTDFDTQPPWSVSGGEFRFNGATGDQYYDKTFNRPVAPDFEYTIRAKWVDGKKDVGFGMIFRYLDKDNFFSFEITQDGYFQLNKIINGYGFDMIPWKRFTGIRGNDYNTLKIICGAECIKCYINDVYVGWCPDPDFNKGPIKVGFTAFNNVKCVFDDFILRELSAKEKYGVGPEVYRKMVNFNAGFEGFGATGPWRRENGELVFSGGDSGMYHTNVPADDYEHHATISVKARWLGGIADRGFGLVFGYADRKNFYDLQISGDGYYRVARTVKGEWVELTGWKKSDVIRPGFNELKVTIAGSQISYYINGVNLGTVKYEAPDYDFVGAGVGASSGITCLFDDFCITETLD